MFHLLIVAACLAAPVWCNSAGAPVTVCSNGLTPEHGVDGQSSKAPYSFSGAPTVRIGQQYKLTLSGDTFLGFAIQARRGDDKPIGQFQIIDAQNSQLLKCDAYGDTLTHRKIHRAHPIRSLEVYWTAPAMAGKVTFIGTVVKTGNTFWIRKVVKEINVILPWTWWPE